MGKSRHNLKWSAQEANELIERFNELYHEQGLDRTTTIKQIAKETERAYGGINGKIHRLVKRGKLNLARGDGESRAPYGYWTASRGLELVRSVEEKHEQNPEMSKMEVFEEVAAKHPTSPEAISTQYYKNRNRVDSLKDKVGKEGLRQATKETRDYGGISDHAYKKIREDYEKQEAESDNVGEVEKTDSTPESELISTIKGAINQYINRRAKGLGHRIGELQAEKEELEEKQEQLEKTVESLRDNVKALTKELNNREMEKRGWSKKLGNVWENIARGGDE